MSKDITYRGLRILFEDKEHEVVATVVGRYQSTVGKAHGSYRYEALDNMKILIDKFWKKRYG